MKCEANGSTITGYWDGANHVSGTNTDITGGVRGGIYAFGNDPVFFEFETADLAAAAGSPWYYYAQQAG